MTNNNDDIPVVEAPDPLIHDDAPEIAPLDNEVDFDDERDDDQLPLDLVEAIEVGVLLDDPESVSDDDDDGDD